MSSNLFTAYLKGIFRYPSWERKSLSMCYGRYLNHLKFAGAPVLIPETAEDLQEMVSDLNKSEDEQE